MRAPTCGQRNKQLKVRSSNNNQEVLRSSPLAGGKFIIARRLTANWSWSGKEQRLTPMVVGIPRVVMVFQLVLFLVARGHYCCRPPPPPPSSYVVAKPPFAQSPCSFVTAALDVRTLVGPEAGDGARSNVNLKWIYVWRVSYAKGQARPRKNIVGLMGECGGRKDGWQGSWLFAMNYPPLMHKWKSKRLFLWHLSGKLYPTIVVGVTIRCADTSFLIEN